MKRRDITLGEMQDECTRIGGICVGIKNITEDCKYLAVCPFQSAKRKMCALNLTDPPRFDEKQMDFWRGWFDIGATLAIVGTHDRLMAFYFYKSDPTTWENYMGFSVRMDGLGEMGLKDGQRLDLAELLGKDGADAKA